MTIIRIQSANTNAAICTACGGACCKNLPGEVLPGDLSPTLDPYEVIVEAHNLLESGLYTFDWYERFIPEGGNIDNAFSSERGYYLRPVTVGMEDSWRDPSHGGRCTLLHDEGCELTEEDRPSGCRSLIPQEPLARKRAGGCHPAEGYTGKRSAAQAWFPFKEYIIKLFELDALRGLEVEDDENNSPFAFLRALGL